MFVCLPCILMPSKQKEDHIFTKDLKMKPPMPTSQVNLNWFVTYLTSLLLDRLHIFQELSGSHFKR